MDPYVHLFLNLQCLRGCLVSFIMQPECLVCAWVYLYSAERWHLYIVWKGALFTIISCTHTTVLQRLKCNGVMWVSETNPKALSNMYQYCVSPECLGEGRGSEVDEVEPLVVFYVSQRIDSAVQQSWQDVFPVPVFTLADLTEFSTRWQKKVCEDSGLSHCKIARALRALSWTFSHFEHSVCKSADAA